MHYEILAPFHVFSEENNLQSNTRYKYDTLSALL